MEKEYRHQSFPTDEAFVEHHRRQAERGDERSIRVMDTHVRLEQERLYRRSVERFCAAAFEPEALNQK